MGAFDDGPAVGEKGQFVIIHGGLKHEAVVEYDSPSDGLELPGEDGWSEVLNGITTVEEIVRVSKTDVSAIV